MSVMYGYTAVQSSQLLFSTHASRLRSPPPPILHPPLTDIIPPLSHAPDAVSSISRLEEPEKATIEEVASSSAQETTSFSPSESTASLPVTEAAMQMHPDSASQATHSPIHPTVTVQKRKFREQAVPSSRIGRAVGFAGLGAGLVWGATTDAVSRALGPASDEPRGVLSEANAQRLANALCRMRGAALKIGQMLSIQDEDMVPPAVAAALEQVCCSNTATPFPLSTSLLFVSCLWTQISTSKK